MTAQVYKYAENWTHDPADDDRDNGYDEWGAVECDNTRESLPMFKTKPLVNHLFTPQSKQPKTGNMPQGHVGETRDEARASCEGCKFLKDGCYHWFGSSQLAQGSMQKAHAKDKHKRRSDLGEVLKDSAVSANFVRIAVGGDPNVFTVSQMDEWRNTAREYGLKGLLGYTHFPETKGSHLKGLVMGSCDTLEQADRVMDSGWRVAVVVPAIDPKARPSKSKRWERKGLKTWSGETFTTPKGRRITICPNQAGATIKERNGRSRPVTCNDCGMCDATTRKGGDAIGFLLH